MIPSFGCSNRNLIPEQMDDPALAVKNHRQALGDLERLNFLSDATHSIWQFMEAWIREKISDKRGFPLRVLDLATGAGDIPRQLMRQAHSRSLSLKVDGCDRSSQAVAYARDQARRENIGTHFFQCDVFKDPIPDGYDGFINSLFLHHLSETDTAHFIQRLKKAAPRFIILQDLIRSRRGLLLAYAASRLCTRSKVVHFDAPQSVRAAYTPEEIGALCQRAGLEGWTIRRVWPSRFAVIWERS